MLFVMKHYNIISDLSISCFHGQCKTLKVPGIGGPIAIEIEGKPYAPVIALMFRVGETHSELLG